MLRVFHKTVWWWKTCTLSPSCVWRGGQRCLDMTPPLNWKRFPAPRWPRRHRHSPAASLSTGPAKKKKKKQDLMSRALITHICPHKIKGFLDLVFAAWTSGTHLSENGCYQSRQALGLGLPFHWISWLKRDKIKMTSYGLKSFYRQSRLCVCYLWICVRVALL